MRRATFLSVILVAVLCVPAHGLTLHELRVRTKLLLGVDTAATGNWSDVELNYHIADAVSLVSHLALCIRRDTTILLEASKAVYAMPSDYIKTEGVVVYSKGSATALDKSPRGLSGSTAQNMGKTAVQRAGGPLQFFDQGEMVRQIIISPMPLAPDTAVVSYFAVGKSLDYDTTHSDLPPAFCRLVPLAAASAAWAKTRLTDPYWSEFYERLQLLAPNVQPATEAEPTTATPGAP